MKSWKRLIDSYSDKFGNTYKETNTEKRYVLVGILWGKDDLFYYVLSSDEKCELVSCDIKLENIFEETNK